jgi:hypothetical protein
MARRQLILENMLTNYRNIRLLETLLKPLVIRFNESLTELGKPKSYHVSFKTVAKLHHTMTSFSTDALRDIPRHKVLAYTPFVCIRYSTAQRLMLAIKSVNEQLFLIRDK